MRFLAIILAGVLAACASAAPGPVSYNSSSARAAAAPQSSADAGERGGLAAYALQPSEVQPFDPAQQPRIHVVAENESLQDVAVRYRIPVLVLIDQNRLEPPYRLAPGRRLTLPAPRVHVVARGETLRVIAERYQIDPRSLGLYNRMIEPFDLAVGDRVYLPAESAERSSAAAEPVPSAPQSRDGGRFAWPLRGELVARFGAREIGGRLDGIEISGRGGAPVFAADAGEVVYAGGDLPAYGELVLVRHDGGYVTAYGYTERALVREGQRVRRGEAIAHVGPRARLFFQVRRGADVVDPLPLLSQN
jgi:murein DD-endopeptidase MepM/ murein hydrolase activator NlpD